MNSEEELRCMYCVQMLSQQEIAKEIGVSKQTIYRWMKKHGIETRTPSEVQLDQQINLLKPSRKKLHDMYLVQEMSQLEIAGIYDVSRSIINKWMKEHEIETRTKSESKLIKSPKPSEEELYSMYWVQWMSTTKIAEKIGVTPATVFNWIKSYGIETRTISESTNGNRNGNWQGGISSKPYCDKFNNLFREAVRERDGYTCQLCGFEQNGRRLSVHHIHYDKSNCYPDVVALCCSCNSKVNSNRDYWEEYFENQLLERGLYCWGLS